MLHVSDLTKSFPPRVIFKNVSFDLDAGGVLHLEGRNGAGKTTLLKIIVGLLPYAMGEIIFKGGSGRKLCEYLAADGNGFFAQLSAWDNLCWWAKLKNHSLNEDEILPALQRFGIRFPRSLAVGLFSTGMKRRLSMSRLLLSPSPLWVLDEPLAALDAEGAQMFSALLLQHVRNGGAALIVSHDDTAFASLRTQRLELKHV